MNITVSKTMNNVHHDKRFSLVNNYCTSGFTEIGLQFLCHLQVHHYLKTQLHIFNLFSKFARRALTFRDSFQQEETNVQKHITYTMLKN